MMVASCSFALMAVMVKLSGGAIPLFQQVFFRNLLMVFFAFFSLYHWGTFKESIKIKKAQTRTLFLRCFFGFFGVVCLFYASNNLFLADAQILQKLNPFFVTIFAVILLKEKMTLKRALTICLGFIGAIIIINPQGDFSNIFPSLIGIASAFFGGMAYVMVRKMSGQVNPMVIIFYFSAFSTLASLVPMLGSFVSPTPLQWVYLIFIGIFAASGQYFITNAYTLTEASKVTLFDYTGVAISPILGFLIFGEHFKLSTLLGMIIIILSGYISSRLRK